MNEPNTNAVLIAFFGTLNVIAFAIIQIRSMRNTSALRRNTTATVQARDYAHLAANQTSGPPEAVVRKLVDDVLTDLALRAYREAEQLRLKETGDRK